jgi:hypothetical protein
MAVPCRACRVVGLGGEQFSDALTQGQFLDVPVSKRCRFAQQGFAASLTAIPSADRLFAGSLLIEKHLLNLAVRRTIEQAGECNRFECKADAGDFHAAAL